MSKENNIVKQEWSSNLELYRIIVMLLIVAHHSVVCSEVEGLLPASGFSLRAVSTYLLGMWGKTGINCFVLITGYFMCTKAITVQKYLKLLLEVLFYYVGIYLLFVLLGHHPFYIRDMWMNCIPVQDMTGGFTSAYLMFFLFIPFLNACIQHIGQKQHARLCGLSVLTFTLLPFVPGVSIAMNYVLWFSVIYIIGAYIRLYPETIWKSDSAKVWGGMTVVSVLLSMASVAAIVWYNAKGHHVRPYMFVSDSNAPLALLTACCSFMWFRGVKLPTSKVINRIAASAFGVLLIHSANGIVREWLWEDTLQMSAHYAQAHFVLYAIGCVLAIYAVCTIIDMLRIRFLEKPLFNVLSRWIPN